MSDRIPVLSYEIILNWTLKFETGVSDKRSDRVTMRTLRVRDERVRKKQI